MDNIGACRSHINNFKQAFAGNERSIDEQVSKLHYARSSFVNDPAREMEAMER